MGDITMMMKVEQKELDLNGKGGLKKKQLILDLYMMLEKKG